MKKNIKRSVFSLVLCAMLVFCIGFYSSVEPTTAWYSDTGSQEGSFNMDEIDIKFVGDGIATDDQGEQYSIPIELNFKAATKAADTDGKPEPMFEYAAEFYTFKATNKSADTTAKMRVDVVANSAQVNSKVYELGPEVSADAVSLYIEGATEDYYFDDVYLKATVDKETGITTEERVLKIGDKYYDAYLVENLNNTADLLLEPGEDNAKTYCIGIWVEYSDFDTTDGVDTISCDATVNISAEQYVQTQAED